MWMRKVATIGSRRMANTLHKNKYLEHWNGMREVSEKTFRFTANDSVPKIIFSLAIPFFGLYFFIKEEMIQSDTLEGIKEDKSRYL